MLSLSGPYFFATPSKKSNTVWLGDVEPRPYILKEGFRSEKRLFTLFFDFQGLMCVDVKPQKPTKPTRSFRAVGRACCTATTLHPAKLASLRSTCSSKEFPFSSSTWPCSVAFAFPKNSKTAIAKKHTVASRTYSSDSLFRASRYTSFWVPCLLHELAKEDEKVHRGRLGVLRGCRPVLILNDT